MKDTAVIELSENLPDLTEEDLYTLKEVLKNAGILKAVSGNGRDPSDQTICDLSADIDNTGHFTAVFSLKTEDGQIRRGPSAELWVEMTQLYLAFRENELKIQKGTEYEHYRIS